MKELLLRQTLSAVLVISARESRQKISYVKFIGSMDMFLQTVKPV